MKLRKLHNDNSKDFLQKILLFIDTTLLEAVSAKAEDTNKILVSGLVNVKDAIFSEIVKDNFINQINLAIDSEKPKKNQEKTGDEIDINQEKKSASDQ